MYCFNVLFQSYSSYHVRILKCLQVHQVFPTSRTKHNYYLCPSLEGGASNDRVAIKHARRTHKVAGKCVRYRLLFLGQIIGSHASSFNLAFAFAVSRTRANSPSHPSALFSGRTSELAVSFFLHLPASDTHVYVRYPIEYAMRMCSEIPCFFPFFLLLATAFRLFSHALPPSTFFLWNGSKGSADFPNKDVISVDYSVCISAWKETAERLWYFHVITVKGLSTFSHFRKNI